MLNARLVRKQDAELHFEVMAYLIRQFGAPPRPPVPSPLHKTEGLEKLQWEDRDTRSAFAWAEDNFGVIKSASNMTGYDAELVPAGDGLEFDRLSATRRLEAFAAGQMPYRKDAATPIFYDPRDCAEPGHFTTVIVLQLAELKLTEFKTEASLTGLMQRMATLTAAAYNRQGFVLANLPHHVSTYLTTDEDERAVPHRVVLNAVCFATCLALRVRRQSTEQIIATYGPCTPKSMRRKIRQACHQIDTNMDALAVLQMLCDQKSRPRRLKRSA